MPATSLYPSQARGREVFWLLTMEWAGLTIRVAQEDLDVRTAAGDVLHFVEGLGDIDFSQRLELGGDASGMGDQPIEMLMPQGVSVVDLVEAGHDLSSARLELARWIEGTTWESRCIRVVGRAVDPEYGADDEPVAFTISDSLVDDATLTGSPATAVVGANWPELDSVPGDFLGEQYPIVIGHPGLVSTLVDPSGRVTGSHAEWIDYRRINHGGNLTEIRAVVAGHHVQATSVYVCTDDAPGLTYRIRVANGYDDAGHPVAFLGWFYSASAGAPEGDFDGFYAPYTYYDGAVDVYGLGNNSLPGSFNGTDAKRLYISWRDEADLTRGGMEYNGRLLRDAGDVISWIVETTGRRVDRGRMAAAAAALSQFKFDGVILERMSVWEWLRDNVLSVLPISLTSGPEGLYAVVWRSYIGPSDATFLIDVDARPDIERVSAIRSNDGDRINRVFVKYAYRFRTREYAGEVTIGTQADVDEAANPSLAQVSAACERCRAQLKGEIREKVIEAPYVYDDASARAIGEAYVAAFAGRQRTVEYILPEADYIHLRVGAVGQLRHAAVGMSDRDVQVMALAIVPEGIRVELAIRDR